MESRLLNILVCPICKGRLYPDTGHTELVCRIDQLAFPVRDGIAVMLEADARVLTAAEIAAYAAHPAPAAAAD